MFKIDREFKSKNMKNTLAGWYLSPNLRKPAMFNDRIGRCSLCFDKCSKWNKHIFKAILL